MSAPQENKPDAAPKGDSPKDEPKSASKSSSEGLENLDPVPIKTAETAPPEEAEVESFDAAPAPAPEKLPTPKLSSSADPPKPASPPRLLETGRDESSAGGIHGIIKTAKGHAANAGEWIHGHPVQAGLIGAGVAIGSLVAGWVIFRALRGGKDKKDRSRLHGRSINSIDAVTAELPSNAFEKRSVVEDIDWDDEEFLEFLNLFPDLEDIAAGSGKF